MADQFEDIRSYRDHEVKEVMGRLFSQPMVSGLLNSMLPGVSEANFKAILSEVNTVLDFQDKIMAPIIERNVLPTFTELSVSGLENLDKNNSYLFISNHRDIVLDSALMNYFLHKSGFSTAEIAIGDNLLKDQWIEDLVRLNKSFIVKRGLDKYEILNASKKMSQYIKDTIQHRNQSVWIAQRAGRAKDGNDKTNPGLISMFGMSAEGDAIEHFTKLNIVPVSVSYEYDPCDGRKTNELYTELTGVDYVKSEKEDVESMKMGIILPKGKGHIHFGTVLNEEIKKLPSNDRKAIAAGISGLIDQQIHSNYKLWSSNLIANDLLLKNESNAGYSLEEKKNFLKRVDQTVGQLKGDQEKLRQILLGMYQQPLLNLQSKKGNLQSS